MVLARRVARRRWRAIWHGVFVEFDMVLSWYLAWQHYSLAIASPHALSPHHSAMCAIPRYNHDCTIVPSPGTITLTAHFLTPYCLAHAHVI